MVEKIRGNNLEKAENSKIALIDFSATWCGPCRMLEPVLEEVSEELKGQVDFFNCDVDQNPDLAQKFGIMNIPALFILKDGKPAANTVGFQPKENLLEFIKNSMQ